MEKLNHDHSKLSCIHNTPSQVEQTLSDEDLSKLVRFFSLMIEIDQQNKRKKLRESNQANESGCKK